MLASTSQQSFRNLISRRAFQTTTKALGANTHDNNNHDRLLVIGSGVAGSAAALIAAQVYGIPATILHAGQKATDCNSYWAQGGIIYRNYDANSGDSSQLLAHDIHRAGAGLCYDPAVQKVATEGPDRVRQLLLDHHQVFANVPFQLDDRGNLALCLEASHTAPRILFQADHTGRVITEHITEAAQRHPLITFQENAVVTDLIVEDGICVGVKTLGSTTDSSSSQQLHASRGVVLASGGLAGIYQHSTNPAGFNALGSSVSLALRAGASTRDLEYIQFHPTALNVPKQAKFLLTEALRGEGAVLRNHDGHAFAKQFHADGELAPRDVVARGVFQESQKTGQPVYLDITHRQQDWLYARFPTIQQHLQQRASLDLAKDWLPVTPAAHYTCGGVDTDLQGRTSIPNLYAAGEAARTGLHGGNRLASTSLLEGLVFGAAVADHCATSQDASAIQDEARRLVETAMDLSSSSSSRQVGMKEGVYNHNNNQQQPSCMEAHELLLYLKSVMWDHVGVVRTKQGLNKALNELNSIESHSEYLFAQHPSRSTSALRDAARAGHAVAKAAFANETAAGAHYIVDGTEEEEQVGTDPDYLDDDDLEEQMFVAAAR